MLLVRLINQPTAAPTHPEMAGPLIIPASAMAVVQVVGVHMVMVLLTLHSCLAQGEELVVRDLVAQVVRAVMEEVLSTSQLVLSQFQVT